MSARPQTQSVYVTTYETRDALNRIVEYIDRIYTTEDRAEERARFINEHEAMFPAMVADVQEHRLSDGLVNVPIPRTSKPRNRAKLTVEDVLAIRERRRWGEPAKALAAEFGVTHQTIYDAISGRTWRNV